MQPTHLHANSCMSFMWVGEELLFLVRNFGVSIVLISSHGGEYGFIPRILQRRYNRRPD